MLKPSQKKSADNETILIERMEQGDYSVFWELWNNHKDYLYSYCLRKMNNNATEAQEVLSISMLKAWDKLPVYAHKITNLRGWLRRLTQNICIDFHRQRNRSFTVIENIDELSPVVKNNDVSKSTNSPDKFVMGDELKMVLYQGINLLSDSLKIPFILRFVKEKSYTEISQRINLSESNVRKRIQKARSILKKQLNKYILVSNHLDYLVDLENNSFTVTDLQFDELFNVSNKILPSIEQDLEKIFYGFYTTYFETLSSPLFLQELAYV